MERRMQSAPAGWSIDGERRTGLGGVRDPQRERRPQPRPHLLEIPTGGPSDHPNRTLSVVRSRRQALPRRLPCS